MVILNFLMVFPCGKFEGGGGGYELTHEIKYSLPTNNTKIPWKLWSNQSTRFSEYRGNFKFRFLKNLCISCPAPLVYCLFLSHFYHRNIGKVIIIFCKEDTENDYIRLEISRMAFFHSCMWEIKICFMFIYVLFALEYLWHFVRYIIFRS